MDSNAQNSQQENNDPELTNASSREIEKAEEDKLKAKYPINTNWSASGHSVFLQKKLAKGKYFDSGDYQMAKQTTGINKTKIFTTGGEIPTPATVPARKTSIIQPKFSPAS